MVGKKIIALLAVVFLAGCIGGTKDGGPGETQRVSQTGERAPWETSSQTPPSILDPGVQSVLNETVHMEHCNGIEARFEQPKTQVASLVPPGFIGLGATDDSVSFVYWFVECERIVVGTNVSMGASLFQSLMWVDPINQTWQPPGLGWCILDTFADGVDFPDYMDAVGASISRETVAAATTWTVEAETSSIEVRYASEPGSGPGNNTLYHWFGADPFTLSEVSRQYSISPSSGLSLASGTSRSSEAIGQAAPVLVSENVSLEMESKALAVYETVE